MPILLSWFNPLLSLFILVLKLSQIWEVAAASDWLLCPFDMFPFFSKTFLVILIQDISGLFSAFSAPSLESAIFPRSSASFYWRLAFRNQDLGARCTHCYRVVVSRPSQWNALQNIWMYTIHIQTRIHLFVYLSVLETWVRVDNFHYKPTAHGLFLPSPFLYLCLFFSSVRNFPPIFISIVTYLLNSLVCNSLSTVQAVSLAQYCVLRLAVLTKFSRIPNPHW